MHSSLRTVLMLLSLAVLTATAACNDNNNLVSTTPTSIVTTSATFTGTLTKNGAVTHQFSVSSRGNVTATLTKIDPDSGMTIGVSLGTWNGTSCQIILANDQATVGSGLLGTVSGVGNLCLRVYDVGKLTTSEDYSIDVVHP
jgi:hypothetical protein